MDDLRNAPTAFSDLYRKSIRYMNGESDIAAGEEVDNVVMGVSHPDSGEAASEAVLAAILEYSPYVLRKGKALTVVSMVSLMKIFHDELFAYSIECAKKVLKADGEACIGLHYATMKVAKNPANPRMAGFSRKDLNLGFILPDEARQLGCRLVLTQSFATNYPASLFARYLKTISVEGDGDYRIYKHGLI
jgi:hypothetical protein